MSRRGEEEVSFDTEEFVRAWLKVFADRGGLVQVAKALKVTPSTARHIAAHLSEKGWFLPKLSLTKKGRALPTRGRLEHLTVRLDHRLVKQARLFAAREGTSVAGMFERLMVHGIIARGGEIDPNGPDRPKSPQEETAADIEIAWLVKFNERYPPRGKHELAEDEVVE